MSNISWDRDQERLERELRSESYVSLFLSLKSCNEYWRRFDSWFDVIDFLRASPHKDPRLDEILRPIVDAYVDDRDPSWRTILLVMFWDRLVRIHRFKTSLDADSLALWTNVTWVFMETIDRVDTRSRSSRLAQKIVNDTIHDLSDVYRREWDWDNRVESLVEEQCDDEDELTNQRRRYKFRRDRGIEFAEVELRHDQGVEIKRLQTYVSKGVISELDFLLIVGTRIYGDTLVESAEDLGLDYEVAKKRRQRAEAKICRHGKKS